ncbi:MAG: DUF294 nucleotidyltransferase-like domain-containing protein, partial [Micrococcaceae bacterium]
LYMVFLENLLELAIREVNQDAKAQASFAMVAMGRLGGNEIVYASDADVMYVYRALKGISDDEAKEYALRIVSTLKKLVTSSVEPPLPGERTLEIDANLRPEGKDGAMVRSIASYQEYYEKWAEIWEYQALLRCAPVAGDQQLLKDFQTLIDQYRYPKSLSRKQIKEIKRIKARVEAERLPRDADRNKHTKLGRGSLSDIEWLAQLIQLRLASGDSAFRTTETAAVLDHAQKIEVIPAADSQTLKKSWLLSSQVRSKLRLFTGKELDVLPEYGAELEGVAQLCGWPKGSALEFEDYYLKITRRGRYYFEKWFYEM